MKIIITYSSILMKEFHNFSKKKRSNLFTKDICSHVLFPIIAVKIQKLFIQKKKMF